MKQRIKLYLSGPMSDQPYFNIHAFQEAAAHLRSQSHRVTSPHELDEEEGFQPKDFIPQLWGVFLGRDVEVIANGNFDAIYLLRDWQYSKGARVEVVLGLLLGLMLFDYETGLQIPASEAMKVISYTILEGK